MSKVIIDLPDDRIPATVHNGTWEYAAPLDIVIFCEECRFWDCIDHEDEPIRRGCCTEWGSKYKNKRLVTLDKDFCSFAEPITKPQVSEAL